MQDSKDVGHHPPRPSGVLWILRVTRCNHDLFTENSHQRAAHHQSAQQRAPPRPVRDRASATEQTHDRVDWMPNIPIRPARHQPAFGRLTHHMKAASTKSHSRLKQKHHRSSPQRNYQRRGIKEHARRQLCDKRTHHSNVADDGRPFPRKAGHSLLSLRERKYEAGEERNRKAESLRRGV